MMGPGSDENLPFVRFEIRLLTWPRIKEQPDRWGPSLQQAPPTQWPRMVPGGHSPTQQSPASNAEHIVYTMLTDLHIFLWSWCFCMSQCFLILLKCKNEFSGQTRKREHPALHEEFCFLWHLKRTLYTILNWIVNWSCCELFIMQKNWEL